MAPPGGVILAAMVSLGDARGQAATEYVALVALVAVVLALAAGLTSGGIGGQVLAGLQRGLCRVAPVGCPKPERPQPDLAACQLERSVRREKVATTVVVVRLGTSGTLTVTRLSDGRATVTLAHGATAGAQVGLGTRLRIGGKGIGGELTATGGMEWTSGRLWRFPSEAAARRFVDTYGRKATIRGKLLDTVRSGCSLLCDVVGWRPHPELPEPDETFVESGSTADLTAAFGVGRGGASNVRVVGRRIARDGTRTWYMRGGTAVSGALKLPGAELLVGGEREMVIAFELDPRGRPRALRVMKAGRVKGSASGKPQVASARAAATRELGAVGEVEATLDLREPAARQAAGRLLEALVDGVDLAAVARVARDVGDQIARNAQVDRRVYVSRGSTTGAGGGVALGLKLDGAVERSSNGMRLVLADTRLPGLPFLPRDDCRPG